MATIRILSGGAAQAVVVSIAADFQRETGHEIHAEFSAVGAMAAKVIAGEPVDAVILTAALIDELTAKGLVVAGSRADLGRVGTGVAVRTGTPLPDVSNAEVLRGNMLAAAKIVCPDPAVATAGKVVMNLIERLGITDKVRQKMRYFPNGYAAMGWLAASTGALEMGITQITEILPNKGVTLAGPLPEELQARTVYSAGLIARARQPDAAKAFLARLTSPAARPILAAAGYEFDE
ncbi:MAG: molybdate ABC transporter substrate-binding protein [Betaproteobacteria bacterium]|nr:molybdate ABC transporter substrate-binding protein [Betaproteobacteria bacterium]